MLAFWAPGGVSFAYAALSQIQGGLCPLPQTGLKPTFSVRLFIHFYILPAPTADGEEKLLPTEILFLRKSSKHIQLGLKAAYWNGTFILVISYFLM